MIIQNSINIFYMRNYKFIPREPHRSPTQFIRTSRKGFNLHELPCQFVPFVQERDGLGRLIKKKLAQDTEAPKLAGDKYTSHDVLSTELSQNNERSSLKVHQVQENINRQFQYKRSHQIRLYDKNKVNLRKNSLKLPTRKNSEEESYLPLIRDSTQHYQEPRNLRKGSEVIALTEAQSPLLRKSISLAEVKSRRKNSLNIEGVHDEITCIKNTQKMIKQHIFQRKSKVFLQKLGHKIPEEKIILADSYITNKIQNRQILELNRYNTFKTLSLKLTDHIDQGHNIFINKMRETKKLAYKLKINIEQA